MPAQERLGLDDQEGMAPGAEATGEQHQEGAIRAREQWSFDAAAQHDELVTEESVPEHKVRFAAKDITYGPSQVSRRWSDPERGPEDLQEERNAADERTDNTGDVHGRTFPAWPAQLQRTEAYAYPSSLSPRDR
jgi:hypothetical protein